jgi:predicted AAA+ superfamily ATPase
MRDSIIEPVLGRDISGLTKIAKPALFRQAFRAAMGYPAQVISYQKILGSLQEGGNAATIKHYLELFQAAYLLKLIEKFAGSRIVSVTSSPKILPLAPALCNAMLDRENLMSDPTWRGRLFEALVGAHLLKLPGRLSYWSEGNYEVDFVREVDGEVIAYEVKSGLTHRSRSVAEFKKRFPDARIEYVDREVLSRWLF